ncbi:hypothetical protein V6N13_140258 [Hibiscus sabdariffa]
MPLEITQKLQASSKALMGTLFHPVCLLNISLNVTSESPWSCSYIQGYFALVSPETYETLKESVYPKHSSDCYHLSNHLRSSGCFLESCNLLSSVEGNFITSEGYA